MVEQAPEWISQSARIRKIIVKLWRAFTAGAGHEKARMDEFRTSYSPTHYPLDFGRPEPPELRGALGTTSRAKEACLQRLVGDDCCRLAQLGTDTLLSGSRFLVSTTNKGTLELTKGKRSRERLVGPS